MRQSLVFIIISLLFVSSTTATTYYVSPTGSDAADGLTEITAWLSLDNGNLLEMMQPGDSVLILPGAYSIYSEYKLTQSGTGGQPIVYTRIRKGEARIDANNSSNIAILVEGNHIEIDGLHLLNAKDDALHIEADSCSVTSCYIGSPGRRGIRIEGNHNFFLRNVIAFAGEDGIKNEDAGKRGNRYYHNTIYQSTRNGIEIKGGVEECRVFNCIIVESGDKGIKGPVKAVCAFNNVWGNLGGDYVGVVDSAGGISKNHKFVASDRERFDLKLAAHEIDAGMDLGFAFTGSAPDMGAFEKFNKYYVSPVGNDENDGTSPMTSWRTINNGDSLLYPGDTVYILAGTYPDSVTVTDSGLVDDPIVYTGIRDSSVIQGTWHHGVRVRGQYLTLDGLTVIGASSAGFYVTEADNELYECRADSSGQYGIHIASGSNNSVIRTLIANAGTAGVLTIADSLQVLHCTFADNQDFDIDAAGTDGASVINNVFVGGMSPLAAVRAPSSASVRYCEFHAHPTKIIGGAALGTGCFSANPQFLDPATGNYRLQATSPAIDAGENVGVSYQGPAPDLGAYETGTPVSLTIIPVIDSMLADSQYHFSVEAIDSSGFPAKPGPLAWSHTFSTGTINPTGLFTPQLVDTAAIAVEAITYALVDTTAPIRVVPGSLATLHIAPERDTISADSTRQFSASGFDSKGNTVSDLDSLAWSVLNDIGTVDSTGLFSAGRAGNGFVRASSDYGITGSSDTITIVPGEIASVDVQPSINILVQGSSHQYSALGYDADSNLVDDLSALSVWSTTDTSGSVNAVGFYTAGTVPSPPVYRIKAEWGGLADSGEVSVISNGVLAYVQIEFPDGTALGDTTLTTDNDTITVFARGYDSGDNLLGDVACAWGVIGADSIGSVTTPNGISTGLRLTQPGTGRVVAEYSVDVADTSGVITCQPGVPAKVVIFPDTAMSVNADSQLTFTLEFYDADGNATGLVSVTTWGVIGGIGTVDTTGTFLPEQVGTGYVYVLTEALADTSALITVSPGALVRIEVSPDSALVSADSSVLFTATGFDAEDNTRDPGVIAWQLTDAVGAIDGSGLFDAVSVGTARVIASSDLGPVDTSAILEVLPGILSTIVVSPDSLEISTDSTVSYTAVGFDNDGNSVVPSTITWSSFYNLGDIDGTGTYDPHTVGIDRVMASSVVGSDTIIDTTTAAVIVPGVLHRLSISPNAATMGIADSLQFSTTGYDEDFNVTSVGTVQWTVLGGIGTIDSTGLFVAQSSGDGQINATSVETGVSAISDLITVEALRIAAVALGDKTVQPDDTSVVLLKCRLINDFARAIAVNSFAVNSSFSGAGNTAELLANVDSLRLYVDVDDNSLVGPGDSLVAVTPMESTSTSFIFDSVAVAPASALTAIVAADVAYFARDADSLDLYILPGTDVTTTDGTAVEASDSLNSQGIAVIDGMIAKQISLATPPSDSISVSDSLVYLATIDLPRNGYQADTLQIINIANYGSASESDVDSLVLFADDGDGLWGGVLAEQRVARLVFTGSHWTRSGIARTLTDQLNRFYLAARFANYGENGTSVRLVIPENGLGVASGNDGPIDGDVVAGDSIVIITDHRLEISSLSLSSRSLVPGTNTGPLLGLQLFNGTESPVTIQQLSLDFVGTDPDGASQIELNSQIDSVGLYLAGDADYDNIGKGDVLLAAALLVDGRATWHDPGITIAGSGASVTILTTCWLSGTQAKNGNTVGFGLVQETSITVDPDVEISALYPLLNPDPFIVDAFPSRSVTFSPTGTTTIFGGEANEVALVLRTPGNGYAADTINTVKVANLGTASEDVFTAVRLYADLDPAGFGAEDSLLADMSPVANGWAAFSVCYPVPVGGADLCVTVDVSTESFEGGTLTPAVPEGGLVYSSGMIGPDDLHATSGEDILIFPAYRVTAVSIPLETSEIYPGSSNNSLMKFALYNGYIGQARHLTRVSLTNTTKTRSHAAWADQEVGQVQLYFDDNHDRMLNGDSLVGSGLFADGRLTLNGMNVELPPESLSYFFVTGACPLKAIDGDTLSTAIEATADLSFAEPTSLNGDLPLTRAGYLTIDGSIAEQYSIFSTASRSLSPGDSSVVLFAFQPAVNGDQVDSLTDFWLENDLDATDADIHNLQLWSDVNADQQWQPADSFVGVLSFLGGSWMATGLEYEVDTSSLPLIVTGTVSDTARSDRAFRGILPVNGCQYTSGNDGPIDAPLTGDATFTISSSALRVQYGPIRTTYSVGEPILLTLDVTNRLAVPLDSVYSNVSFLGDSMAIVLDSSHSGPASIDSDSTRTFSYYFSGTQSGTVVFQSSAFATTTGDSSAVIETEEILIQDVPSGLQLSLHNFMPTAVARGQQNIFPLSLELSHPDTASAPIAVKSLTLSTLTSSGIPQPANTVFSRLLIGDDNATLSVVTAIPDSSNIRFDLTPTLILQPADTAELVLLIDIADSALATSLMLGIESIEAIDAVDGNTDSAVSLIPSTTLPLRTASCRIDDPSQTVAISNVSQALPGVNAGQNDVAMLGVGLRHPGAVGMSQVQLVGLSLMVVSGADTLIGSSVTHHISVYRSAELLGEVSGSSLDTDLITVDLGSGLTLNPNTSDSLLVLLSVAPGIVYDSFTVIIPDSSVFQIRDGVSGSEVTAVTDHDVLSTGSVFPLLSAIVRVYQPTDKVTYCISDPLLPVVVAGADGVSLVSVNFTHGLALDYSPILISRIDLLVLDSSGAPLDPGQLLDRTGYRIGTGMDKYYSTLTLINGATVFPLGDTGIVLLPSDSLGIELIADIESDSPYDNFRVILDGAQTIQLQDAIDSTQPLTLVAAATCDTVFPYQSSVSSVLMPAGAPLFHPGESPVRIAGAGQSDFVLGDGKFSYVGGAHQGEIEFVSLQAVLFRRVGSTETPVPVSGVFSQVSLLHGEDRLAVDSVSIGDTMSLSISPSLILAHESIEEIVLAGDIRLEAPVGNYRIRIMDSSAIVLRDKNLGSAVYPDLSAGAYPAMLGAISIATVGLETSFSNYPNPFIAEEGPTTITYVLPEDANIDIEVFSITGDPVAHIARNEPRRAGPHQDQTWDGLNDTGLKVVPGTYFCRITAYYQSGRTESARRKVSVIR